MQRHIFFYMGKRYEMTDDEIAAAYHFKEQQNLLEDAARQLLTFIFDDDPDNVSEIDQVQKICDFERTYGIRPEEVNLRQIISKYEKLSGGNVPENIAWESAIWEVLHFRKRK